MARRKPPPSDPDIIDVEPESVSVSPDPAPVVPEPEPVPPEASSPSLPAPPPLSVEEEAYAFLLSSGMSSPVAYQNAFNRPYDPVIVAQLNTSPYILARVVQLNNVVADTIGVTKFSHLDQMAYIRDKAIDMGEVKVAFLCEHARGQVAGFYNNGNPALPGPAVQVNVSTPGTVDVRMKSILFKSADGEQS
jgi:hypothetical protein